jgi:hypothetical protein
MIVRGLRHVFSFPIIDTIVWWRQGQPCGSAAVSRLLELGPHNRTRELSDFRVESVRGGLGQVPSSLLNSSLKALELN